MDKRLKHQGNQWLHNGSCTSGDAVILSVSWLPGTRGLPAVAFCLRVAWEGMLRLPVFTPSPRASAVLHREGKGKAGGLGCPCLYRQLWVLWLQMPLAGSCGHLPESGCHWC